MDKRKAPLPPEEEREQLESLLGRSLDLDPPGHYVVTQHDPDDGEQIIGQATSLLGAMRCLARHIEHDGEEFGEDVEQRFATTPLSHLEIYGMEDMVNPDNVTTDVGDILEEHPELELVIGWYEADLGLGIYRAPARITETTRRIVRRAKPDPFTGKPRSSRFVWPVPDEPSAATAPVRPPAPPREPTPPKTPAKWSIN